MATRARVDILSLAAAFVLTLALFRWTDQPRLLLLVAALNGFFCMGQYSWIPVWIPELVPTHLRATALAFTFNAPRFIAFLGPLLGGLLIANYGGYGGVASIISCIYVLGFAATALLPETAGRSLPDRT